MKLAVIYSRVSSVTERQSTERQVSDLLLYAERNNFEVIKIFEEKISGSKKNEERSVLMECLDCCCRNNIHSLLTSELSRIGRSTLQVLKSLELLHASEVNVYVQNLGLNTLNEDKQVNPLVSMVCTVMAEMANIERNNIRFRLNSGRAIYIAKGGKLGRTKDSNKSIESLKEEYKEAISYLKRGYSIRNTAKLTGKSISTIQRVRKTLKIRLTDHSL